MNWQEGMKEELREIVDKIRDILKDESEERFVDIMDTVRAYAVVESDFDYSENEVPPIIEGYPEALKGVVDNYKMTYGDISEFANEVLESLIEPNKNMGGGGKRKSRRAARKSRRAARKSRRAARKSRRAARKSRRAARKSRRAARKWC